MLSIPYHKYIEAIIRINGKAPDFEDYFYQKDIYDLDLKSAPSIVWKTSRQVGKSTNLKNRMIGDSILIPFFKTLYVSPSKEQTYRFSRDVYNTMIQSPYVRELIGEPNKMTHRAFKNGSEIFFSYASHDAERIRGLAGISLITIDEMQSIENSNIIPVILEVSAESEYGYTLYCGTPLSTNNLLEYYWQNSVQHEWVVKCDACGKYAVPHTAEDMLKMIGKEGPICPYCGKPLYPPKGHWAIVGGKPKDFYRKGFHITRIFRYPKDPEKRAKQWRDILIKLNDYSEERFLNEVLGVSVEVGGAIISEAEIDRATYDLPMTEMKRPEYGVSKTIMGVDWGVAGSTSFTVYVVGGFDTEGKFKILYAKKFMDTNILQHVDEIAEVANRFNVFYVAADFGVGKTNNALLKEKLGYNRILEMQYVAQNKLLNVNRETGLITIDRTMAIEMVIHSIKTRRILFPQGIKPLAQDLLNVYEEETHTGRKVYRRQPEKSDDFLHALTFAYIAADKILGGVK